MSEGLPYPFEWNRSQGVFVHCIICGRKGLVGGQWMEDCIRHQEHPFECTCGKRYPSRIALAAHIRSSRQHHHEGTHERVQPKVIEPLKTTQAALQHRTMLYVRGYWSDLTFHERYGAARYKVSPFQDWWATQRCRRE